MIFTTTTTSPHQRSNHHSLILFCIRLHWCLPYHYRRRHSWSHPLVRPPPPAAAATLRAAFVGTTYRKPASRSGHPPPPTSTFRCLTYGPSTAGASLSFCPLTFTAFSYFFLTALFFPQHEGWTGAVAASTSTTLAPAMVGTPAICPSLFVADTPNHQAFALTAIVTVATDSPPPQFPSPGATRSRPPSRTSSRTSTASSSLSFPFLRCSR